MIATASKFTEDDLRNLPPVVDVPTAAAVLGIGRSAAYDLIRTEKWPTPTVRVGEAHQDPDFGPAGPHQGAAVKYGSVYQRHSDPAPVTRDGNFNRIAAAGLGVRHRRTAATADGKRRQITKSGFPTKGRSPRPRWRSG